MKKFLLLFIFIASLAGAQTRPHWKQIKDLPTPDYVCVQRDFGATGNGITDDRPAIQAAINYVLNTATAPTRIYFPPTTSTGGYYKVTDSLLINPTTYRRKLTLFGDGYRESQIRYTGTDYVDVLLATGGLTLESFGMEDLWISGGTHGRYSFCGDLSVFANIERCYFSGGAGFLYINNPQYGKISDCIFRDPIRSHPTETLSDVWGEDSGLLYIGGAGLWEFSHNEFARCGADPAVGVVENILHIYNSTGVVKNVGFENMQLVNITTPGQPQRNINYAVKCSGVVTLEQLYFEAVDTNTALIKICGTGEGIKAYDLYGFNPKSTYIVENNSESDIVVDKVFMSNAFFDALGRGHPTGGDNRNDITFTNTKIVNGTVTFASASSDVGYVAIGNNKWFAGVADAFTGAYAAINFKVIPRILGGYAIASGTDALGPLISVTAGKYLRPDGELVDSYWHSPMAPATLTNTLTLRFHRTPATRQLKYYQVRINAAGGAYMTASTSAILHTETQLSDPYQNIIAEFYLDASDVIGTITTDLSLLYVGGTLAGTRGAPLIFTTPGVLAGSPTLVPVATGSIYLYPTSNASYGINLGQIAVVGGATPTWQEFGALIP